MVVVIGIVTVIIIEFSIRMDDLYDDVFLREVFKVPIDRGQSHVGETFFQLLPDIFRAEIGRVIGKDIKYGKPLRCCL